jgi:hypothetical protein
VKRRSVARSQVNWCVALTVLGDFLFFYPGRRSRCSRCPGLPSFGLTALRRGEEDLLGAFVGGWFRGRGTTTRTFLRR